MSEHPAYVRHQIVVPVVHNEEAGSSPRSVDPQVLLEIQKDVIDVTGGATVAGPEDDPDGPYRGGTSTLIGMWVDEGRAYREPVLTITADGDVGRNGAVLAIHRFLFRTIAEHVAAELNQVSVYYTNHPVERWYISPPDRQDTGSSKKEGEDDSKAGRTPDWVLVLTGDADINTSTDTRRSSDGWLRPLGLRRGGDTDNLPAGSYLVGLNDRFVSRHFSSLLEEKKPRAF